MMQSRKDRLRIKQNWSFGLWELALWMSILERQGRASRCMVIGHVLSAVLAACKR